MDERIKQILELVWEINEQGADLSLELRKDALSIHDCNNNCKQFLVFELTENCERNCIYFNSEVFKEYIDKDLDSAIAQLKEYRGKM